jgi:hypothetical protein
MRFLIIVFFLISCSQVPQVPRPGWVEAVRKGEETLRVTNGSKTYYRRIAGSADLTKQTSCNLVIMKAEEDLRKEYPLTSKIPYVVEVLYYDPEFKDCAVTLSISGGPQNSDRTIASADIRKEDEASALVLNRSEIASKFALTGLTKIEFEAFSNDKVSVINEPNLCSPVFKTDAYSIHGSTHVCWKGEVIAGYCTSKDKQCWTRTP